jgi:hypothetical protein
MTSWAAEQIVTPASAQSPQAREAGGGRGEETCPAMIQTASRPSQAPRKPPAVSPAGIAWSVDNRRTHVIGRRTRRWCCLRGHRAPKASLARPALSGLGAGLWGWPAISDLAEGFDLRDLFGAAQARRQRSLEGPRGEGNRRALTSGRPRQSAVVLSPRSTVVALAMPENETFTSWVSATLARRCTAM